MKIKFIILSSIIFSFCISCEQTSTNKNNIASMANPASVFCEKNGGKLEIRKQQDGGEYGMCIFDDKSECDEWAFFRNECKKGDSIKK